MLPSKRKSPIASQEYSAEVWINDCKSRMQAINENDFENLSMMFQIGCLALEIDVPERHLAKAIGINFVTLRHAMAIAKHYNRDFSLALRSLQESGKKISFASLVRLSLTPQRSKPQVRATMRKLYEKASSVFNNCSEQDEEARETAKLIYKLIDRYYPEIIPDPFEL